MLKLLQQRAAPDQLAHLLHSNAVAVANIIYTVAPGEFTVLVFFGMMSLFYFNFSNRAMDPGWLVTGNGSENTVLQRMDDRHLAIGHARYTGMERLGVGIVHRVLLF